MSQTLSDFRDFTDAQNIVRMPGGFGTTLQLKGYKLKPDAWSGEANLTRPDLLKMTHGAFHDAGADVHTTNTFRTHVHFMERVCSSSFRAYADQLVQRCRDSDPLAARRNFESTAHELAFWASKRAVDAALSVQAASDREVFIGGSYGPLGDTHSYDPSKLLPREALHRGHAEHAQLLADLGVNLLFPETIPTLAEAIAMTEAAERTGLPYITSFVLDEKTGKLFDGTPLEIAVRETAYTGRVGVMLNCTPVDTITKALDTLLDNYDGFVGAYPNGFGKPAADNVSWDHDLSHPSIAEFSRIVSGWSAKDPRVKFLGGCCGASPEYIQALFSVLQHSGTSLETTSAATGHSHVAPLRTAACGCFPPATKRGLECE